MPSPHKRKTQVRKTSEILRKEKEDIVAYVKEMFSNSMLTGVPQIVSARSTRSKVFKTIVFLGSVLGFLYQTSTFLVIYFDYPTLVDVQVTTPPFVDLPSITVCNRNGLKRSVYCKMKPENCEPLKDRELLCKFQPEACYENSSEILYPTPKAYHDEKSATQELLQEAGHTSYPLIKHCMFESVNASVDICRRESYKPFIMEDIYGRMKMCHIINARWSKASLNLPNVPVRAVMDLVLDFEPEEYFRLDRDIAAQVAVHSPWSILNPFTEGIIIQPSKIYIFHLKETIKNLLPWPYQTNCTDYIEQWRRRGGNGPLSKEMCIEECILNQTMDHCHCVLTNNLYPHNFNFCSENTDYCTSAINYTHCFVKCSPACHSRQFDVEVLSEDIEVGLFEKANRIHDWKRTALLQVIFKRSQVNIYTYRAKYESIELYSFLGGFIGIWLGISLIALFDFLESVGSLVLYVMARMKESTRLATLRSATGIRSRRNSLYPDVSNAWAKVNRPY